MGYPTAPGSSTSASDTRPALLSRLRLPEAVHPAPVADRGLGKASGAPNARRSWTINGRFLTQPVTGVQRYAREIVTALDQLIQEGGRQTVFLCRRFHRNELGTLSNRRSSHGNSHEADSPDATLGDVRH